LESSLLGRDRVQNLSQRNIVECRLDFIINKLIHIIRDKNKQSPGNKKSLKGTGVNDGMPVTSCADLAKICDVISVVTSVVVDWLVATDVNLSVVCDWVDISEVITVVVQSVVCGLLVNPNDVISVVKTGEE
jgi:hypothetical protein